MKRYISYILAVLLVASLSGCRKVPVATPSTTPTQTTAATEPAPTETQPEIMVDQQPMAAISMPVVMEDKTTDDGTVIFSYVYQNITLTVPEPEVADAVIVDFLNRTDHHETADSLYAAAKKAYEQGATMPSPYLCSTVYAPMRIDPSVLSLLGNYVTYEGGAHGSQVSTAVSYDLITGKSLTWKDILIDGTTADDICALVLSALQNYEYKDNLFEDHPQTVKNIFSQGLQHHTDWYFSEKGLCCFFSPYEIGPFAAGTVVAEIPYSDLVGILKDDYFPPERDVVKGQLITEKFDPEKQSAFSQFAEVILDGSAEQIVVYTNSIVYDVRLETGHLSSDGTRFIAENTIFGCATLTPGDALMIQAPLDDPNNAIQITYTSAGETLTLIPQF